MIFKKKILIGIPLFALVVLGAYCLSFPEKIPFILGTQNAVKIDSHFVKMRRGWYAYERNDSIQSASFVKGGVFSIISPPGHLHVKFLKDANSEFLAGAMKHSTTFKVYPWGEARLLNDSFYLEIMKIKPPGPNRTFFVPAGHILIDVLELDNIDEVEQIQ